MSQSDTPRKKHLKTVLKLVVRCSIFLLVCWGIWRTVLQAQDQFAAQNFSLSQVDVRWLLVAGVLYLLGLAPAWLFWHRTLQAMGQQPRWRESLRAFYIGHLGKYVPGKALVVVLRTGFIRSDRVDTSVAAASVFVETLTMMAVGAFISAAILGSLYWHQWQLFLLSIALLLVAGAPTLPPIFRRLVQLVQVKRANPAMDRALAGLSYRLMALGWLIIPLGWVFIGASLWAVLRGMPAILDPAGPPSLELLPLLTACVGLAMVAGFLSLLPGGIGVREFVVMTLLQPSFGAVAAIVSAVLLRLVWLLSEMLLSAMLYILVRSPRPGSRPESPSAVGGTNSYDPGTKINQQA